MMPKLAWLAVRATATLAFALDPERAIPELVHTSWTEKDGAPNMPAILRLKSVTETGRSGYEFEMMVKAFQPKFWTRAALDITASGDA